MLAAVRRDAPGPVRVTRVDFGDDRHYRFNASVIDYGGRRLLAYRTGWAGARVHVAELGPDGAARRSVVVSGLGVPGADYGQEDPRLFVHRGRLHVGYTGVEVRPGSGMRTGQFYAELDDGLQPVRVYSPHYPGRAVWEKNWAFFSHKDALYAVYSVMPHKVLRVDGDAAAEVAAQDYLPPWSGGHMRGGAPPVLVGDRYYHWFHGRTDPAGVYNTGVMTFAPDPPFRVLAVTPRPLMTADPTTKPADQYCAVVFACGAVLDGREWLVSYGVHDRWTELATWDATAVDDYLRPVK